MACSITMTVIHFHFHNIFGLHRQNTDIVLSFLEEKNETDSYRYNVIMLISVDVIVWLILSDIPSGLERLSSSVILV